MDPLSQTFSALADPTRRALLARLATGAATVGELAEPFDMSLPAVSRHLRVLTDAGLIERHTEAQWRRCELRGEGFRAAADWIEFYRRFWEQQFDRLDAFLKRTAPKAQTPNRAKERAVAAARLNDLTLRLTRRFDASPERLFDAWTDQEQFAEWFGPKGVTTVYCDLDPRTGGAWRIAGPPFGRQGLRARLARYLEVKRPERLVFTFAWHDKGDHAEPREHETTVTLDFKPLAGGKTEMTMVQTRFPDPTATANHNRGWDRSFDKLDALLARNP